MENFMWGSDEQYAALRLRQINSKAQCSGNFKSTFEVILYQKKTFLWAVSMIEIVLLT